MFATAAVATGCLSPGQPLMAYYASFYFGAIELSSLPLLVVDLFHPKHKDWQSWLTGDAAPKWLAPANEAARVCFAVLFLLVRTMWFPFVSFAGVLWDVIQIQEEQADIRTRQGEAGTEAKLVPQDVMFGLYVMAGLNIFFSCLQMYWGSLIVKQIAKKFSGKDKREITDKKER